VKPKVLIVSHAGVLASNRDVYARLAPAWEVHFVVPTEWRDGLRSVPYSFEVVDDQTVVGAPVWGRGRPQRYIYLIRIKKFLRALTPDVVVIEEEPFSLAARQWARILVRFKIPFVVQSAENLDKSLPWLVRRWRASILAAAAGVLARSPAAADRAREWGAVGRVEIVPHGVLEMGPIVLPSETRKSLVGFVGRLTEEKGVRDFLRLVESSPDIGARVAGDGPLRSLLEISPARDRIDILGALPTGEMPDFYRSVAVVVMPSRTTSSWSEQFGRVLVEASAQGTPVVAYDSGEIPWVTGHLGLMAVTEGDEMELSRRVHEILANPALAYQIGRTAHDRLGRWCTNATLTPFIDSMLRDLN
jgi:glycosyltransferase involved in cell wall biosynthesis